MLKNNTNERGLTLVEVLAVLVIASIISIFVISILTTTTKEDIRQKKDAKQLYDETYILKLITKDIRKSTKEIDGYFSQVNNDTTLILYQPDKTKIVYEYDNSQLKKKSTIFGGPTTETIIGENLSCFHLSKEGEYEVVIELSAEHNCGNLNTHKTNFKFRKG